MTGFYFVLAAVLLLCLVCLAAARCALGTVRPGQRVGGGETRVVSRPSSASHHHLGVAINANVRQLGPDHVVAVHPLDRASYEPLPALGGEARLKARGRTTDIPWHAHKSWESLSLDKKATAAYIAQRAAVLNNPNLDWGPVLAEMLPKLQENREYIGLANLDKDGKTLRIVASEASPVDADQLASSTSFAGIPSDLVEKYTNRPAMFIFHTHPSDARADPLPSSHDLSTAIFLGATTRFAASVVISRYGVIAHTISWDAYRALNAAKDWKLAMLNLSHDVVAAHESVRSWSTYTIAEYLAFYPRHRLLDVVFPSSEMVGDMQNSFVWDLETPIDHPLIADHHNDITAHRESGPGVSPGEIGPMRALATPVGSKLTEVKLGFD